MDITGFGAIAEFGSKLADKIWPDKVAQAAERAKFDLAMYESAKNGDLETLKASMSAILAEAQSNDPWTSRARPSFLYVIYIMILISIPMGVVAAFAPDIADRVAAGMGKWLNAIPEELYALFGIGYLGYAWNKSSETKAKFSFGKGK